MASMRDFSLFKLALGLVVSYVISKIAINISIFHLGSYMHSTRVL